MYRIDGLSLLIRLKCSVEDMYQQNVVNNKLFKDELIEERAILEAECNRLNQIFRDSMIDMDTFRSTWTWDKMQEVQDELFRFQFAVGTYTEKITEKIAEQCRQLRQRLENDNKSQ